MNWNKISLLNDTIRELEERNKEMRRYASYSMVLSYLINRRNVTNVKTIKDRYQDMINHVITTTNFLGSEYLAIDSYLYSTISLKEELKRLQEGNHARSNC